MAGFIIGDAKRKAIEVEKGAFELTKPTNNGIVEQEQNGVTPPRRAPQHADKNLLLLENLKILLFGLMKN
ncbi:hypothetical protein TURTL08_01200 [Turicimonas sp. TL08]